MEYKQETIKCDICDGEIYLEDDCYYGDIYYNIDGYDICEECILEYMKAYRKQG